MACIPHSSYSNTIQQRWAAYGVHTLLTNEDSAASQLIGREPLWFRIHRQALLIIRQRVLRNFSSTAAAQAACKVRGDELVADHVFLARNEVNTPPTQLSSVIGIMPPPINTSVADVVHRRGSQGPTEAALELPASVQELHVRVHVGLAGTASDRPRVPKVNCLHPKPSSGLQTWCLKLTRSV